MPLLTILHTNDFHGKFTREQSQRLATMRTDLGSSGLLLDAGDAGSSGNVTYKPGGEPIMDLMNDAGFDAMTVGNRDFHFSYVGFLAKLMRAEFPILCANVRAKDGATRLPVKSHISMVVSDIRCIVFGLTVPMITDRMSSRHVSSWIFDDPISVAQQWVTELRPQCDLLICLSHIGLTKDRELLNRVHGIDLLVGGHTHQILEEGERVGTSMMVQAGSRGKLLGKVQISGEPLNWQMSATVEPL